ncbi:MAG: uroporphyrinogen-III synthase [Chloroflexota bacterium]
MIRAGEAAQPTLGGRVVALLESRRATELADLVTRYGGVPWSVPALGQAPPDDSNESAQRLRQLCAQGTDVLICLTGVGARALFELAAELGLEPRLREVLAGALVAVRGPKPRAVLRELGIRIDRQAAEPSTSREVLTALAEDRFEHATIQLYGGPDVHLADGLRARGVQVLELPLYRWALPQDVSPMIDLIDHLERAWALAVTSAGQLGSLFAVAASTGREAQLLTGLGHLKLGAVGPVAARALQERGLTVAVEPAHSSMGALIRDLARLADGA